METLRIRIYNVLFGDAIFLRVPDEDADRQPVTRHVLIDCGNALAGAAGDDAVFKPVLENIQTVLAGAPLDLYVMTHEHMDHVQGMLHGAAKLGIDIKARQVWLTASSAEDYYERFDKARRQRKLALTALDDVRNFVKAAAASVPREIAGLMEVNNPRASKDCIDHIRTMCGKPEYIHRGSDLTGLHPFVTTKLRVLAPEEDTSVYYAPLRAHTLGLAGVASAANRADLPRPLPPAGVAAGHFVDLVNFRAKGMRGNLLAIDRAANNSSIVLELEWRGWRLMFPGDAEEKSWRIMASKGLLQPVHFLKVSHHGSVNGSPTEVMQTVLPVAPHDTKPRFAVVSTGDGAYDGVPNPATLAMIEERATLHDTRTLPPGEWFDLAFEATGSATG